MMVVRRTLWGIDFDIQHSLSLVRYYCIYIIQIFIYMLFKFIIII